MTKLLSVQNDFTSGEVSFKIKGRTNIEKYQNGLEECENYRVLSQGPLERRNGSQLVARVKDNDVPPSFFRFIVSATQRFILEIGDLYIRFFVLKAAVEDSNNPGAPFEIETPYTIDEVPQLQFSQSEFSLIIVHGNHPQAELVFGATAPDDWTLSDQVFSPPPTFEQGTLPETTLTAAASTGLGITFTASGTTFSSSDIGRSIEGVGKIGLASIRSHTSVTQVTADILEDFEPAFSYGSGEWLIDLSPLTEISFNAITRVGGIVTVASVPLRTATFLGIDVGKYILANGGVMQIITIIGDGHSCEAEILKTLTSSDNTENWTLEVPTWSEERGFPSTVTQAQQRLLFAATQVQPQTLWFGETGIINGFGLGDLDADSFEADVLSNEITTIQWVAVARDIIIGTTGGEHSINISNTTLTFDNVQITDRSSFKSDLQNTISIGSEILFIQKGSRKIISYLFDFRSDTFEGEDLTFISEHITESGVKQLVYGQEPNKQIYAVTNDGVLLSGTYDRKQNVIGFTRYVTDGKYLSVMAIPSGEFDEIWVIVQRMIDSNLHTFIEVFDESSGSNSVDIFSDCSIVFSNPLTITVATIDVNATFLSEDHGLEVGDKIKFKQFTQWENIDQHVFTVDSVLDDDQFTCGYDSSAQNNYQQGAVTFKLVEQITGLGHLEGKTVEVKVDNAAHSNVVVFNGEIALEVESAEVVVGLPYTSNMTTLPKEYDIGSGSMQGQNVRYIKPILRVDSSIDPIVNGEKKANRIPAFNMDEAVPLFTGDLEYASGMWDKKAQLNIIAEGPFPFRLLGIYGSIQGNIK